MSCAVFTFLGLYALAFGKSNRWLIGASFAAAVALFILAAFLAWADEHKAKLAEIARNQQPDVSLVWDWSEDQKKFKASDTEKIILVENRSGRHIYNVQIEPVKLAQELAFDLINEIAPGKSHIARGRWDGKSSETANYVFFFGNNEQQAVDNGWVFKKTHNRGLSDAFMKIPMAVRYESDGAKWRTEFEFIYDIGDESLFLRKTGQRLN